MLDLSPHIALTKKQKLLYRIGQVCVFVIAVLLACIFAFRILFPEMVLRYGHKNIDPTYRISEPQIKNNSLSWSGALTRTVADVEISLSTSSDLTGQKLTVHKGFTSHLTHSYAVSDFPEARFDQSLAYPPGTLLTGSRGHAVVSMTGTRHAFDSALTLKALGYEFERSQETSTIQWSDYTRDSLLSLRAPHPPGTIFYERDTDQTFLYTGSTLTPTHPTEEQSLITVSSESRTATSSCTLQKHRWRNDVYTCTAPLAALQDLPGKDYLFALAGEFSTPTKITLTFTPDVSHKNLSSRIDRVREALKK